MNVFCASNSRNLHLKIYIFLYIHTHNGRILAMQRVLVDAWGLIDESPEHIFCSPEMDIRDVSTGYLEDALIEFSGRSKRRRLSFNGDEDKPNNDLDHSQVLYNYYSVFLFVIYIIIYYNFFLMKLS